MKSYMHPFLVLVTLFVFTSFSCKKTAESRLPPATQTGANTFGCIIDGHAFIPSNIYSFPVTPGLNASFSPITQKFTLYATQPPDGHRNGLKNMVYLEIMQPVTGINDFGTANYAEVTISQNFQLDKIFTTKYTSKGNVTITRFDTNAKIISGTFSFDAAQTDSIKNIISITDGRFDVTY